MSSQGLASKADPEEAIDASSHDWEDVKRRQDEISRRRDEIKTRLDTISLEYSRILKEIDDLIMKSDAIQLGQERLRQEADDLYEELHDIFELSPTDPDEDVGTNTADREDDVRRRLDAICLENSRLTQEDDEVTKRSDVIFLEKRRLDQEEADLNQEEAVLDQEDAELDHKWRSIMAWSPVDQDQDEDVDSSTDEDDVDTSTDEEDSTGELDDDMFLSLSQMASSLCSICCSLARGRSVHRDTSYHPSLSSLKKSIDAGCRLCVDVAESLEKFCKESKPPAIKKEFWSIKYSIYGSDSHLSLYFSLCQCELGHPVGARCEHAQRLTSMVFYPARKLGLGPEFLDPTLRTSSAKSAASLSVVRSWYQQCLNHATCRNWRQETRVLPTRVLQIIRPDSQSPDLSARIFETKSLPTSTPYATLSHCWGKGVIFKLLKSNFEDLRVAIPIGQLPKVFQDAIHISFEIGISYLWIDSLCIVQDSKDDWTYEAKRMGDVYLHGAFNISATGYEDGLSGLFSERKALPLVHIPLSVDFVQVNKELRKKTAFRGIYIRLDRKEFKEQVPDSPLFERAWVAQERVLSAAIIHYTREKVWWECNQEIFSEAFTKGPYLKELNIWQPLKGSGRDRIRSLSTQSKREDIYLFWNTFLDGYAHSAMTFNRDRFPAVAGIARILGELIDDDFIAGFWSGDLVRSLVMTRLPMRASIQDEQLAPSWSWASSTAGIDLNGVLEIKQSRVKPLDGVRILRVLSDIPGFKSDLQSTSFEKSGVRGLAIRGALRRLPDNLETGPEWMRYAFKTYDNKAPCEFRGVDNIPEDQKWRLKDPTHILLLAKVDDDWGGIHVQGLLVQIAEVGEPNTFHRSGEVYLSFQSGEKWDEILEILGLREKHKEHEASLGATERGLQDLVLI